MHIIEKLIDQKQLGKLDEENEEFVKRSKASRIKAIKSVSKNKETIHDKNKNTQR